MQRTRPRTLNHSLQDLDVLMYSSKLHVQSCAGFFCVTTVHSIVLQHFNVFHYVSQLPSNSTTLVFSLLIIFILFVHSSRMFYYFVCSHVHVVGSCPATAGCRPPACLPACLLPRGYRVIPSYLKCAQLWATVFIIMCVESAVAPTSACWQLMLGRSPWSAPPSQILHKFHVIQTLLRLLVYSQLAINSSCL